MEQRNIEQRRGSRWDQLREQRRWKQRREQRRWKQRRKQRRLELLSKLPEHIFGLIFLILCLAVLVAAGWERFAINRTDLLLVFTLSIIFPVSAIAYQVFQKETRIQKLTEDLLLLGIFPGEDEQDRETLTKQRYDRTYPFWNYMIQSTFVLLLTVFGLSLFFWPPSENSFLDAKTLQALRYGFLGAYLFSVWLVYRRYTTSDLHPTVYTYCAITIVAGLIFNYIAFEAISTLSNANPSDPATGIGGGLLAITAFSLGYFPYLAIRWFNRVAFSTLGEKQRPGYKLPLAQIDGISELHEVRLRDEGIDNIQNLASADLEELLLKTRFGAKQVIDWVDQAILFMYLDPSEIETFHRAGVRSYTDFRDQWKYFYENTYDQESRREVALQFQTLPERLDALYCATDRGPNVARVDEYWTNSRQRTRDASNYIMGRPPDPVNALFDLADYFWETDQFEKAICFIYEITKLDPLFDEIVDVMQMACDIYEMAPDQEAINLQNKMIELIEYVQQKYDEYDEKAIGYLRFQVGKCYFYLHKKEKDPNSRQSFLQLAEGEFKNIPIEARSGTKNGRDLNNFLNKISAEEGDRPIETKHNSSKQIIELEM